MEWLPVQIVKPARKSWKILLLEYCSPMSQVYCAGNKATVAPLGWAHHIIDIYRLQKIYNKWVRWGFCEVDIQVETCGAMKRACRGISSFVRGGIASVSCGKKRHLRLTLIWSGSEVGVIVALIYLLLHACLPLIRSYVRAFPWMCKVSKLLQSPNSTHLSVHLSTLIRVQVNTHVPDILPPSHFLQLLLCDPGAPWGQMEYTFPPVCSGFAPGLLPVWSCSSTVLGW